MNYSQRFQNDDRWEKKAKDCIDDEKKMSRILEKCYSFLNKNAFSKVRDSLWLLYNYVKDSIKGRYKTYSIVNLTLAVAAIVYVVSPFDFLNDYIPLIGFTDDISVVLWAAKALKDELNSYSYWKNNQSPESSTC